MLTPAKYAALSQVVLLILGAGNLAWSAADADRFRMLLGTCEGKWHVCRPSDPESCHTGVLWNGCETLVSELMISGGLLILAGVPIKRADRE